jgi:MFS family permease
LFIWNESRAKDPIIQLGLFRNRTFTSSVLATALISFGFFGGIVFIPLWFQAVNGSTATQSGYQILPMMAGLMAGSIGSGQIVSRTGRYKWLLAGAMTIATVGILLMTQLHADTPVTTMWVWLAIMGLGIGPSMAVFTIIVQNAVPVRVMGTATSSLTFFRQIGGSIGLAIAGTVFGSSIISGLAPALVNAGVPAEIANQIPQHVSQGEVTSVGGNLGGDIVSRLPEAVRPVIEPLLPAIINGVHEAFSTAIANAMWFGVAAGFSAALIIIVLLPELPLRQHAGEAEDAPGEGDVPARIPAFD